MKKFAIAVLTGLVALGAVNAFAAEVLTPAQKKAARKAKEEAHKAEILEHQAKGGTTKELIRIRGQKQFREKQAKKEAKRKSRGTVKRKSAFETAEAAKKAKAAQTVTTAEPVSDTN